MTLVDDFRSLVTDGRERVDGSELLPTVLSQACVGVLPVAGAGLSVTDVLRVPLGASDEVAARAERLQTSLGEGPCLAATSTRDPLVVGAADIALRWPVFHQEFVRQTPFRSVVSVPVVSPPWTQTAALDLYLTDTGMPALLIEVVGDLAEAIAELLFASSPLVERRGASVPIWLTGPSATQRLNVWLAVGMLIGHAGLSSEDALAVLRAYAFGHGITLDDVAEAMTTRHLDPDTVLGPN